MTTNKYIVRLKAQLDQAIVQRDHWKQLAHKRNYIEVSETDPESRTESVWRVDADTVRRMWAQIGHMEAALAEGDAPQPGPDVRGLVEALDDACEEFELRGLHGLKAYKNLKQHHADLSHRQAQRPGDVNRCPTCSGSCTEICAKARP
ncbi:hypothetical protein ACPA2N_25680 [Ectopseudomonas hydrolytica]|uniref:hypothetical protein n=1 Tax=Ectopseudomonas hydrolytica TaxID=2493633 RepID=UPI003C2E8FC9